MILQQLRYLAALAREGHFGRAAQACHVSQATVSEAIRRLEDELGVQLVRRGHRFQGLTAEGEQVLRWAHRILADCDDLRADVAAMRGDVSGYVRLGAIPTALPVVSLLTVPLRERHPGLRVSVRSLSSREIGRGLRESELDIGVTYVRNEPLDGMRSTPFYEERYVLLAPSGGEWEGRRSVTWQEAADAPLCLLSPEMQNRRIVDRAFADAGATARPTVETNSISTLHAQVREAGLCAVVPDTCQQGAEAPAGMTAIPLEPLLRQPVGLVWRDRDPEPALVRAVVAIAAAARVAGRTGS